MSTLYLLPPPQPPPPLGPTPYLCNTITRTQAQQQVSYTGRPTSLFMYSSPSHRHSPAPPPALSRNGSAPGSLLKSLVDSVSDDGGYSAAAAAGQEGGLLGRYFSGDMSCLTAESSCKADCGVAAATAQQQQREEAKTAKAELERTASYGFNEMGMGEYAAAAAAAAAAGGGGLKSEAAAASSLIRHSSSPAGFLNQFLLDNGGGYPSMAARGLAGGYVASRPATGGGGSHDGYMNGGMLKSQLSFSRQDSLSQLSDMSIPEVGDVVVRRNCADDMGGSFRMGSWDDTNSIVFSSSPGKRAKDINGEIAAAFNGIDSEFSMPNKGVDMAAMEKFLHLQQDSVPCKIRAKRGFATHPRSIAERDRRTRISEKLRKLQDLMPNMDKQTNTAEMLDLAVQYIKSLQSQVQELQQERANCTCGSRHAV